MSRQKSISSAKNWPKTVFGCKAQFCLFSLRTRGGSSADETCYCDFAMLPLKLYILTIEVALSRKLSSFLRLPDWLTYFENYPHNWQWDRADPYPAGIDGATCGPCSGASKAAVKLVKLGDYRVQSWCFFCHISALMSISAWQSHSTSHLKSHTSDVQPSKIVHIWEEMIIMLLAMQCNERRQWWRELHAIAIFIQRALAAII